MRVSVERDDPGFIEWPERPIIKVFLDGVELRHCVTADTDQGYIKRYRMHPDGRAVVDNGVVCTEELWGAVAIETINDNDERTKTVAD